VQEAASALLAGGEAREVDGALVSGRYWAEGVALVLKALEDYHRREPLRLGRPLEELRQVVPGPMGFRLADALIQHLAERGQLVTERGTAARSGFRPVLTPAQEALRQRIRVTLEDAGLAPPSLRDLVQELGAEKDVEPLLRLMEASGEVLGLEDGLFFLQGTVRRAATDLVSALGGATDLGPADFKEALPVTRKHLLPLLRHFDTVGVTTRRGERRTVATQPPEDPAGGTGS